MAERVGGPERAGGHGAVAPGPPVLVLMGVSGSGKSTVAGVLAGRLGWDLAEGDDLHPPANVAKMAAGHPLTDADREPWLRRVAAWIAEHTAAGRPGVITCSALKRAYRDVLRGSPAVGSPAVRDSAAEGHVVFVHLTGSRAELAHRLAARHDHFMPTALLDSQLDTLQPPGEDEPALTVAIGGSAAEQADEIIRRLRLRPAGVAS